MANKYAGESTFHWNVPNYSEDVYINYARAMFLEVERRVVDTPPRRPAQFWRIIDQCRDEARIRMRAVDQGMSC